ncbi:MAG TPA: polysaccharide biosynthesis/export family protein, partial [Usitatibacter sp.]|nr:polysaccharide biosynthesis/export family protein [Usitatibacter sp.]
MRTQKGEAGEDGEESSRHWRPGLLALVLVLLSGCVATQPGDSGQGAHAPEIARSSVKYQKEYLLVAGDQIEVLVWRNAEVTRTVTIRPDGYISLPLLQDVKAAGLTPKELAESVTKSYSGRLLNPEVTVIPTQVRQPTVYVLGDVKVPGGYPLRQAATAAQAIALAGGTLRSGWESQTSVVRLSPDGYLEAIPVGGGAGNQWFVLDQVGPYRNLGNTL